MELYGILPTLVAEVTPEYRESYPSDLGIPLEPYVGLGALLRPLPERVRLYARAVIEQKFGFAAPILSADGLDEFDSYNVSDLTPYHAYQLTGLVRRCPRKRLIVTLWENIPRRESRSFFPYPYTKAVAEAAVHFLAVSRVAAAAAILRGIDKRRITLIHPAMDCVRFQPRARNPDLATRWGVAPDDCVLLYNGRLQRSKGLDWLLYSIAYLGASRPHLQHHLLLLVVGSGRECDHYVALSKALNLADRVRFLGQVRYRDLPMVYNLADLFVLPSIPTRWWQEQLGFALLEAMASGLAIIASRCGAIPEVLANAGVLVSPGNFEELAEAICSLAEDEKRRRNLGEQARMLVSSRNAPERCAQEIARVVARCA
jgi:glycosyltransferase involved in cell wall biosynthesis